MTQTGDYGLDPSFWESFPSFGNKGIVTATALVRERADQLDKRTESREEAVHEVAIEFTRLFVGPPKPAAAPWETFYASPGTTVGYGQPAIDMRRLLSDMGLEVGKESNQYPDHMGIELLCLAEMHSRAANGKREYAERVRSFAANTPGSWADDLMHVICDVEPNGYFAGLVGLVCALLRFDGEGLAI